jgi:uncharacterized protein involved in exopolysaccharide biosynthesis
MSMVPDSPLTGTPPALGATQSQQEQGLDLNLDVARSLRMRRWWAIGVGLVVLLGLAGFGVTRKPMYEATSVIYVQPLSAHSATDATSGFYDAGRYDLYIQQQLLTVQRPDILAHAVDALPAQVRSMLSPNADVAAAQLAGGLKAERVVGAYEFTISADRADAASAAPIANAIAEAYLQSGQQDDLALLHQQMDSLTQERQRIQDELDKDRAQQAQLSDALGVADTASENGNPFDVGLADLRAQVADARNAHSVAEAQLASVNGKPTQLDSAADTAARGDVELSALRSNLGNRRATLLAEMNGLTPQNPLYKKDQAELDQLSQSINDVSKEVTHKTGQTLKAQLTLEASRTGDVQARLEAELARRTATATADTPKLQQAQDLAASIRALQARYTDVDNAIHSQVLNQSATFAAHMSIPAEPPTAPMASKKLLFLALAAPVGLIFAVIAAVIRQKLDSRIYIGHDVDRILEFPPMAVTPHSDEVSPRVKEEFLFRLVAGLDQAHRVSGASTIVFTAASQDTPIEEMVASITSELETLGYRTMTLSAAETLSPVESTRRDTSSDWQHKAEMTVSGKGTALRLKRESLIDEHLERLKEKVDFLFIKAQPLRSSAETEFVARLADVTLLVVESGTTTRKELRSCLALARRLRTRGLAAVVSELKLRNADNEFIESVRIAERHPSPGRAVQSSDELLTIGRI